MFRLLEQGASSSGAPAASEEVAEAALFFCSPANTYVTGQVLPIDCGLTVTF
ncbi:SDR family oxidoreductase [Sinomonas terrae]|uniref:SDR family oxidoreductase n=1 Tax=Sinomonas terrae TaxID=2908838 RepID=UPI00355832AF